eukprot:gene44010-50310_t
MAFPSVWSLMVLLTAASIVITAVVSTVVAVASGDKALCVGGRSAARRLRATRTAA